MHNFLIDSEKVDSFTDDEKYSILKRMSEEILNQNDIVEFIVDNAPNNDNADFATVTETMRQTYLFLLQGEINILEQLYLEESERNSTNMTMGVALQNVMGEIVLQFPDLINNVRGTSYKADYIYVPDEDSFLVDGVLSDEEFNDYLEETPVEDIVEQTEEIIEQIQGE